MKQKLFLLLFLFSSIYIVKAQQNNTIADTDTIFTENNLMLLHHSWMTKCCNHQKRKVRHIALSKEALKITVEDLAGFNLFYTPGIYQYVNKYLNSSRRQAFSEAAALFETKEKGIKNKLLKDSLLTQWQYFPLAASFFYPLADDNKGNYGYWHFNLTRARYYGLKVNSMIDERKDFEKSTQAAIRCIQDLKHIYQNTDLSLMAFILGPKVLNKKIREAEGSKDIADIYKYMSPSEKALYDKFVACYYLISNKTTLGLEILPAKWPIKTDTFIFQHNIPFKIISRVAKIGMDTLQILNPTLRADIALKGKPFLIPEGYGILVYNSIDSIFYLKQMDKGLVKEKKTVSKKEKSIKKHYTQQEPKGKSKIVYTVRRGDALKKIATRYHVTISQIKKWNHLTSTKIYPNQKLNIYSPNEGSAKPEEATSGNTKIIYTVKKGDVLGKIAESYHVYSSQIKRWNNLRSSRIHVGQKLTIYTSKTKQSQTQSKPQPQTQQKSKSSDKGYIYYTVRSGESLYIIAKKYPGVSAQNIMDFNHIGKHIKVGQKIKIPTK